MSQPAMVVVAGPPGSGKSTIFSVDAFGDGFNVDARAAALNGGSFRGIPPDVRRRAQQECEAFIEDHIARGVSFAVETTLRSGIAIEQAKRAQSAGFLAYLVFVTTGSVEECVRRVRIRGRAGGHAAPEAELRDIYARSMSNLLLALDVFDRADLYDSLVPGVSPRLVGRVTGGRFVPAVDPLPDWLPTRLR